MRSVIWQSPSRTISSSIWRLTLKSSWILITDGMPQGEPWETTRQAVRRVRTEEEAGRLVVFAVGVAGANMKFLARLAARPPLQLNGLRFVELFLWLSASTERVACSPAEDQLSLPPVEWGAP